jgi:proteasome lid subunit RPN8/RPN11
MAIKFTDATPALRLEPLPGTAVTASNPVDDADAPAAVIPGAVDVWIDAKVDRQVMAHLRLRDVEQGGLLLGRAFGDPSTGMLAHVRITGCAPADDAQGTAFSLRMGTQVWQAAQALLLPGDLIVGWYHSHPGLGAFFSDTDRQTQAAFFSNPYSIGWVIDPSSGEEALFLGAECRPVQRGPDRSAG